MPDRHFRLAHRQGEWIVIASAHGRFSSCQITNVHPCPIDAVDEAVAFYGEARQLCAIRGIAAPTHADIMQAIEMLSGDEEELGDYPTVELTQEEFDTLTTAVPSTPAPGDVYRVLRVDNPPPPAGTPGRWFRVTVTNRRTGTGDWSKQYETIIIRDEP